MSQPTTATVTDELMLRARIRITIDPGRLEPLQLEDALAEAIRRTVHHAGGTVEQLQLAVALDPSWAQEGPTDRWTGASPPPLLGPRQGGVFGDDDTL